MAYTFEIGLYRDATEVIEAVKYRETIGGYTVRGDSHNGTVYYTGPAGGQYAASYEVTSERKLFITVLQCPWFVRYSQVEAKVREYVNKIQEDLTRGSSKS